MQKYIAISGDSVMCCQIKENCFGVTEHLIINKNNKNGQKEVQNQEYQTDRKERRIFLHENSKSV